MRWQSIAGCIIVALCSACSKPLMTAKVSPNVSQQSRTFSASPNAVYYAVRDTLQAMGYPVATENLQGGVITTAWMPSTADSHYVKMFDRPQYPLNGAYYQLEIRITPDSGRSRVDVGMRSKTVVANLQSSHLEERKLLDGIGHALRKNEPEVTNLGMQDRQ